MIPKAEPRPHKAAEVGSLVNNVRNDGLEVIAAEPTVGQCDQQQWMVHP